MDETLPKPAMLAIGGAELRPTTPLEDEDNIHTRQRRDSTTSEADVEGILRSEVACSESSDYESSPNTLDELNEQPNIFAQMKSDGVSLSPGGVAPSGTVPEMVTPTQLIHQTPPLIEKLSETQEDTAPSVPSDSLSGAAGPSPSKSETAPSTTEDTVEIVRIDNTELHTLALNTGSEDPSAQNTVSTCANSEQGAKSSSPEDKVESNLPVPPNALPTLERLGEEQAIELSDRCEDIAGAIEACLDEVSEFKGSHFYARAFSEVPNPGLRLLPDAELGPIGLPLNEHEARRILSRFVANGNIQSSVAVLEARADNVRIDNPAWFTFMEGVRKSVCQVLGVADGGKHSPRLDLVSLVLFGPGTSTYEFDTQSMSGAADVPNPNFGSILVTLPSPHIGGITQINYGASITLYEPSPTSYLGTSVLAWYSSPHMRVQEVVPISAGFRLALRYTLVHTNPSKPVPCLPSAAAQMKAFKHALLSWKSQGWAGLQKVVCRLSGNYDVESLGEVGLRGVVTSAGDVRKIEFVDAVARECGFSVGLATLETEIEGTPDYGGLYDDWDEYGDYRESSSDGYDDYDDESDKERPDTPDPTPSEYTMGDVDSKETRCSTLVDIRTGEVIVDELDDVADDVSEHIPECLLGDLESDEPDEEEYGGWKGNGSGSLTRTYRATVLVVWPSFRQEELVEGREYVARKAIECLRGVDTCQPDQKELDYVEFLLEYARYQQRWSTDSRILPVLSRAALRWNDRKLFGRVMKRCRGEEKVRRLGMEGILDAVTKFGIDYMMPLMEKILQKDASNLARLQLLESLGHHLAAENPALVTWIDERRRAVIESLAPLQKPDIVPVFAYIREHGDLATFSRTVLRLVNKFTPADAIFDLANLLHQETQLEIGSGLIKTIQDVGTASQLLSDILSQAISNGDYFDNPESSTINLSQEYLTLACRHIKMCLDMGCDEAMQAILKKLSPERFSNGQRGRIHITGYAAKIIALLPQLEPLLSKSEENRITLRPGVAAFYNSLVVWYGNGLEYRGSNQPIPAELLKVVQLAVDTGSLSTLESLVSAIVKHVRDDGAMRALVLNLHSRLPSPATNPQTAYSLSKMIWDTLMGMISRKVHPSSTLASIRELVDICLEVRHFGAFVEILRRMHYESGRIDKNGLSSVLLPLLPEMWSRLAQRGIGLYGPETGLLAMTSVQVVQTWAERALGYADVSLVSTELGRCPKYNCRSCKLLAQLLPSGIDREEIRLRALGITEGRHVDQQLSRSRAVLVCRWELPSGRAGDFTLHMSNGFYKASNKWKQIRDDGLKFLSAVPGGDMFWLRILGDAGYRSLLQKLDVVSINPRPPLNPSIVSNASPAAPMPSTAPKRPHSQIQSGSQPAPHTPNRSDSAAKRPRLSNNQNIEVIDLTSP